MPGGSGACPALGILNLEALKCHFWRSNTTISVKNLREFLAVSSVFREIRVKYFAFRFLFCEFDENIATPVEIGIFPIAIVYWSRFGIFKQNGNNPDEMGKVGQFEYVTLHYIIYFIALHYITIKMKL